MAANAPPLTFPPKPRKKKHNIPWTDDENKALELAWKSFTLAEKQAPIKIIAENLHGTLIRQYPGPHGFWRTEGALKLKLTDPAWAGVAGYKIGEQLLEASNKLRAELARADKLEEELEAARQDQDVAQATLQAKEAEVQQAKDAATELEQAMDNMQLENRVYKQLLKEMGWEVVQHQQKRQRIEEARRGEDAQEDLQFMQRLLSKAAAAHALLPLGSPPLLRDMLEQASSSASGVRIEEMAPSE